MRRFITRFIGILRLDPDASFEMLLHQAFNWPALGLVMMAACLGGLRWAGSLEQPLLGLVILWVSGVFGWLSFAGAYGFWGMLIYTAQFPKGEVLRLSGFAFSPLALLSLPVVGWFGLVWALAAAYVALRSAYATRARQTILLLGLSAMVAFFVWGISALILATIFINWV